MAVQNANLEAIASAKERLIAQAQELATATDFRAGHERARVLQRQFSDLPHAGPRERELRQRFKQPIDQFYERRRADGTRRAAVRDEARRKKEYLVLRAHEVAGRADANAAWQEMQALMEQWRAAGGAGREHDERLWQQFNALRKAVAAKRPARQHTPRAPATQRAPIDLRASLRRHIDNLEVSYGRSRSDIDTLNNEIKINEEALYYAGGHNPAADRRVNKRLLRLYETREQRSPRLQRIGAELDAARDQLARLGG